MDVTVVTGTFGSEAWRELAITRAGPSVPEGVPWIHAHADTLHEARNAALAQVTSEFVIHLDADDQLEDHYCEAMMAGTADLRAPMLRQVRRGRPGHPFAAQVWGHTHACAGACFLLGNFVIVGACVRTELVRKVGAWWPEPIYEDWSLWLRCHLAGATDELIPDAIYRAHHDPRTGRNHSLPNEVRNEWHYKILAAAQAQAATTCDNK